MGLDWIWHSQELILLFGPASHIGVIISTRGNSLRLCQGRFRLSIRKKFCKERVVKHWSRLHREVMESASLEMFKRHEEVVLRDMV